MSSILPKGQIIATLDRSFLVGDVELKLRSDGTRFDSAAAAEAHARQLAESSAIDAVIVRDQSGGFWVHAVDEITSMRGAADIDRAVRGNLVDLQLPQGMSLQSFMVTPRDLSGRALGAEKVLVEGAAAREATATLRQFGEALVAAGLPGDLINRLRGDAATADLVRAEEILRLNAGRRPSARQLQACFAAARAELRASGAPSIPYERLADPELAARAAAASPGRIDLARALRSFPAFEEPLTSTVTHSVRRLEGALGSMQRMGKPVDRIGEVLRELQVAEQALAGGDHAVAAIHIERAEGRLQQAVLQELPGYGLSTLTAVQQSLARRLEALPRVVSTPPPAVSAVARRLFSAYAQQSQMVLNAIHADGYADFIDTFGFTGRIRPDDASSATLRLNVSLWTVARDIRAGTVRPGDFGKNDWSAVDARAMYDLAMGRLRDDSIDYDSASRGMARDRLWRADPIMVQTDHGREELRPEMTGFWQRSIYSLLAPNEAAESIESDPVLGQVRDAALRIADAERTGDPAVSEAAATIGTAFSLYVGAGQMPENASQALAAISAATGVSIVKSMDPVAEGTTEQTLRARVKRGEIDGFTRGPSGHLITYVLEDARSLAREVQGTLDAGALDGLGQPALSQLRRMLGPVNDPGAGLAAALSSQESSRFWREMGSQVVTIALVGVASGGIGAIGGGFATGLGATRTVVAAARFVATSLTFTTLMGASGGEISVSQYATDMAMFGVLSVAGRYARLAGRLVPGTRLASRLGRYAVDFGATTTSAAAVMSGFQAIEQSLAGDPASLAEMRQQFVHNLAMVTVLHGVNTGLARLAPHLAGGGDMTRRYDQLAREVGTRTSAYERTLDQLTHEMADGNVAQAKTLLAELNQQSATVDRLRADLTQLAQRVSPEAAAEVNRALDHVGLSARQAVSMSASGITPEHLEVSSGVAARIQERTGGATPAQGHRQFEVLLREAGVAQEQLATLLGDLARGDGGIVANPGVKTSESARAKLVETNGHPERLLDLARGSLVFDNVDQVYRALAQIDGRAEIVRMKDRFARPGAGAMRDILLNVRMPNGHIAEIQLHVKDVFIAKMPPNTGHVFYDEIRRITRAAQEQGRALSPQEASRVEELTARSVDFYGTAWVRNLER